MFGVIIISLSFDFFTPDEIEAWPYLDVRLNYEFMSYMSEAGETIHPDDECFDLGDE